MIDRAPMRDRRQPGSKRTPFGIVRQRTLPEGDKYLLRNVLGHDPIAGDPYGQTENECGEVVVELAESRLVSTHDALVEQTVVDNRCLHWHLP
jgi:hypothetical protein